MPTFAVGRAQLLTGLLAWMFRNGEVEPFPVFLDSPMAIETTEIYAHHRELFDEEMTEFLSGRPMREDLTRSRCAPPPRNRGRSTSRPGPSWSWPARGCAMPAGSCITSRPIWQAPTPTCSSSGYQGYGSLGRRLVDGAKKVTIHGEKMAVNAKIHMLGGFSAHAGQTDLLAWLSSMAPGKPRVVLTHGEDDARGRLSEKVRERFGLEAAMPAMGDVIEV